MRIWRVYAENRRVCARVISAELVFGLTNRGSTIRVTRTPQALVSASIVYDHVMSFQGSFKDHILADKAHVISVSFLLDSLKMHRGGVAGNMVYNMALLGVPAALAGAVGRDFAPYREVLQELGVNLDLVIDVEDDVTSTAYLNADLDGNQIASFYPGAGARSVDIDVSDVAAVAEYGIISAGDPVAMMKHAEQIASKGKLIFDPAQQIPILSPEDLNRGIELAEIVLGSDYELGMIERKTGLSVDDISAKVPMTVVTYGSQGSEIRRDGEVVTIPSAPPTQVVDPTGGGDAYRAGLLRGLLAGKDLEVAGRIASQAATYAVEHHGAQEHAYTPEAFVARFRESFPEYAENLTVEDLTAVAPA